jgi:hypothetical protein
MPDTKTAAVLRSLLDELCAQLPKFDADTKINVASRLLEAVEQGRSSVDDLRAAGKEALRDPPTMWR